MTVSCAVTFSPSLVIHYFKLSKIYENERVYSLHVFETALLILKTLIYTDSKLHDNFNHHIEVGYE